MDAMVGGEGEGEGGSSTYPTSCAEPILLPWSCNPQYMADVRRVIDDIMYGQTLIHVRAKVEMTN